MDDTIRSLIRFVVRGFYSKPYVLILDAVLLHSVLSEDDLIDLLNIQRKELRSLCNRLVEDRLLVNHIQKEENNQQRLVTRTYLYIHVTEAIDAIKWKVHSIVSTIKQEMSHYGNPQGYVCPVCGKKVSQLDAISLLSDDKTNFVCDTCNGILVEDDSNQQASIRQAKLEKLMLQVDPIITYLKKIDDSYIEDNTFESSLMKSIPAQSSSTASYSVSNKVSSRSRSNMSSSLQNAAQKSQATLHVSITANDENYEREQLEKERRRQKLEQNALPSWHSSSTVGKSTLGKLNDDESEFQSKESTPSVAIKSESDSFAKTETPDQDTANGSVSESPTGDDSLSTTTKSTTELKDQEAQDALAAYYAQLAENEAEDDEDDDDDDLDDLDLEDV